MNKIDMLSGIDNLIKCHPLIIIYCSAKMNTRSFKIG